MTWRAHITEDLLGRALTITVGEENRDGSVWVHGPDGQMHRAEEGTVPGPTLRLPEPAARALHEALARRFAAGDDAGLVLRRDYDAERARVDRLIDHLLGSTHD